MLVLSPGNDLPVDEAFGAGFDLVKPSTLQDGLAKLQANAIDGLCVNTKAVDTGRLGSLMLECGGVLEQVPDGYCLVDIGERVLWANSAMSRIAAETAPAVDLAGGPDFDSLFGDFQYADETTSALAAALGTGMTSRTTIRTESGAFYEIQVTPLCEQPNMPGQLLHGCEPDYDTVETDADLPAYLLASVRDVTEVVAQRKKLDAIDQAGIDLSDISAEDVLEMEVESRIDILKEKIAHYIEDLLEYETVEIRLLEETTGLLKPLLAIGMTDAAACRELYRAVEGQGVTGYVAATGNSYRCDNITEDDLYLEGAAGACSSLTVPLIHHDEVIGTFNVESRECNAFKNKDLTALERFSSEVAAALNTLELLQVEKTATASSSVEKILCGISTPLDEVLINASYVKEQWIGLDQSIGDRLTAIIKDVRDVRRRIQEFADVEPCSSLNVTVPQPAGPPEAKSLKGKSVLVVDDDPSVRLAAHELLGRYGCNVEASHDGFEAAMLAKNCPYDAVLIDINLPDMSGSECFRQLREINLTVPLILMTGYGYDPSHSIVKARKMGLESVLFKPFRLNQLLQQVGAAVGGTGDTPATKA